MTCIELQTNETIGEKGITGKNKNIVETIEPCMF